MISTLSGCESEDFHVVDYVTRPRLSLMFFSANKRRVHSLKPLNNLAANTQCSLDFVKFIVNICEQTSNFFLLTKVLFGLLIFFPKSCLKLGVRLIHESLREGNFLKSQGNSFILSKTEKSQGICE